jgi:hypothetical protein
VFHEKILIVFPAFEDEADLTAEMCELFLCHLLLYLKQTMNDVTYLVCDNCSVNKTLSRNLGIPLVGCNSHNVNLAFQMNFGLNLQMIMLPLPMPLICNFPTMH